MLTDNELKKWQRVAQWWLDRRAQRLVGQQEEALIATRLNMPACQLHTADRIRLGMVAADVARQFRQPFVERTVVQHRR